MERDTAIRFRLAALIYSMVNAVVVGSGLVTVLAVPALNENAAYLIPAVVVVSFILAAPLAWWVAPHLRARFERRDRPVAVDTNQ